MSVPSAAPAPGDVYPNHSIPNELYPLRGGRRIASAILETCYAVSNGPDRNLYWVYDDIKSSETAIQAPVRRGTCFETQESIAFSQARSPIANHCYTCNKLITDHMTAAEALIAFTAHAAGFPATHARAVAPLQAGVMSPAGTAATLGITAPITIGVAGVNINVAPQPAVLVRVARGDSPSTQANREDYKLLISMAAHREKWSSTKSIAHEFISKLETALRQSPIPAVHWIYFLPLMISEHDRNMQDWVEATITSPNLSWNNAKAVFISHYERADWMDSLRVKYQACTQGPHELVQKYTDRFSALMRHLSIGDADVLNIVHYMNGLRSVIYTKLIEHRSDMRNLPFANALAAAPNPSWDFVSFEYVSSKASSFENELTAAVRDQTRVRHNPTAVAHELSPRTTPQHKRKAFSGPKRGSSPPHKRVHVRSSNHCKWHPESQSHSTSDCRNPGSTAVVSRTSTVSSHVTAPSHSKQDLSKVECYGCHKFGHYKPDCPHKDQWSKDNNKKTYVAKNKGPRARAASVSSAPADK